MVIAANWKDEETDSDDTNPESLYFDPFALKMKRRSAASAIKMKKVLEFRDGISSVSDSDNDVQKMTTIPYEVRNTLHKIVMDHTHALLTRHLTP